MTLGRWRVWYALGLMLTFLGMYLGLHLLTDGNPAWIGCAAILVAGITIVLVAARRRRPTERQEAIDRAAAGPDPRRWRVIEMKDDDD